MGYKINTNSFTLIFHFDSILIFQSSQKVKKSSFGCQSTSAALDPRLRTKGNTDGQEILNALFKKCQRI